MNTDETLRRIGAAELVGGCKRWGRSLLEPLSLPEMEALVHVSDAEHVRLTKEYDQFLENFHALSEPERDKLREWAVVNFLDPIFAKEGKNHVRAEWNVKRFLRSLVGDGSKKLLDVAPCHGFHGMLFYREHHKLQYRYSSGDINVAYCKLHTLLGIDAKRYDARKDGLSTFGSDNDVIVLTEVLEHLEQDVEDRLLSELKDVAADGARCLITFPENAMASASIEPFGHVRQPDADHVVATMSGFSTVEKGRYHTGKQNLVYLIMERNPRQGNEG